MKLKIMPFLCFVAMLMAGLARGQTPPAPAPAPTAPPPPPQQAQPAATTGPTVVFKDGKSIGTNGVRRSGNNLMVKVPIGSGLGEVGYPIDTVAKVEFARPPELKTVASLLSQNKAAEALAAINPVISSQRDLREVPGSFWPDAAVLKIQALVALDRDQELQPLLDELASSASDPETVRMARVQQAANWTRKGEYDKALPVFDAVIKESNDPETLSQAWLNKAHGLLEKKQWEPALLAYLHIPVYYPDYKLIVPAAMLGSARALVGLEDPGEAQKRYQELMDSFPASAEAATAKAEMKKL